MTTRISTLTLCFMTVCGQALADTVTFEMISGVISANDMSPDGRFIVGETANAPYLLDTLTDTLTLLPGGIGAVAVSDDGTVVLGNMTDPVENAEVAAMWTQDRGWQSLGFLPNALSCPSKSSGYELSADGSVAVGLSWDGCNGIGFIWTEDTGMIALEELANGGNRASVVSADGGIIGGFAQGSFSRTPAFWLSDLTGQLLDPPDGDALGEVHGISDDGSTMLGAWNGDAVMWTDGGAVRTVIGGGSLLPTWAGIAMDIADNGTVVGFDILSGNRRAWIQPDGKGPLQELVSYIESNGGDVPGSTLLHVCQAISTDGRIIIGHTAFLGAWRVTIEPDCLADLDGNETVGPADLASLLAAWGPNVGHPADFDGSGNVGPEDLAALLAGWGACP
jgi:uncharacterized membrane protein